MNQKTIDIINAVNYYYTEKIKKFDSTPKGVDWKDNESQLIRFDQLLKVIDNPKGSFSINDIGCGYGKLVDILIRRNQDFVYTGYDISADMINSAHKTIGESANCRFVNINTFDEISVADFSVASGIFNVKLGFDETDWLDYIQDILEIMNNVSRRGFSFNLLTKYSDKEYMRDNLYYADPCYFFDICKRKYSRNVALLHDYSLYEFTIIVNK